MTRFLSESLEATEPNFRLGLQKLEIANGHPAHDIRLTSEVKSSVFVKLCELKLDPADTTPEELYEALKHRMKNDDEKLVKRLRTLSATYVSAEGEPAAGMVEAIKRLPEQKTCFALKSSKVKSLLQSNPPKKAMKGLGYRSLASMIKHEPVVLIMAAAGICEGQAWHKRFVAMYKTLTSSDFEERHLMVVNPRSKNWTKLSQQAVTASKNNIICFKELGYIIILPLGANSPAGSVTASLSLAISEMNEIMATSTFLKLCQPRPDFGKIVSMVSYEEPLLSSQILDQPVPWNLVHSYYSRMKEHFKEDLFEPYVQLEDMVWQPVEKMLADIEPSFKFWEDTSHVGMSEKSKPVSMNLIDNALNLCNMYKYEDRLAHYFQRSLWRELLLRYMKHDSLQDSIVAELQPAMVEELVSQ